MLLKSSADQKMYADKRNNLIQDKTTTGDSDYRRVFTRVSLFGSAHIKGLSPNWVVACSASDIREWLFDSINSQGTYKI